jgi:hypothetical protein
VTTQENRIFKLAGELVAPLRRRGSLALRGGQWEFGHDFAKTPRLIWSYSGRRGQPFAIVPSQKRIIGLGALRYSYAEKKLAEAKKLLHAKKPRAANDN